MNFPASSPRIPSNLVINADDFGLSPSVSRAILEAAREGLINSVSAVAGGPASTAPLFEELAAIPGLRIGAHLTLIEIPPLTPIPAYAGGIPGSFRSFLIPYFLGKIDRETVRREWRAQLLRIGERIQRPISHLDSHQHLHLLPGLWQVSMELRREFTVPEIRVLYESGWKAWTKDFPFGATLQVLSWMRREKAARKFFGSGLSMAFRAEEARSFAERVARQTGTLFELMVHPREDGPGRREMEELRQWLRIFSR
jgi:predicted glycoside hydrolase/deacetylase ChbG (UPF0249 family)